MSQTDESTNGQPETYGVLLVRKTLTLDASFRYRSDRLPGFGDEIELLAPGAAPVFAKVTGIERAKTLPIRATEL